MATKRLWMIAVLSRFLWVCFPQTGYIYPDEFFQATEITAGDIFGFKHTRTWEWSEGFPVRTSAFPYIFTGLPFYILKSVFPTDIITSRILIVAPRLFMATASLVVDLTVYKICQYLHFDPWSSLGFLATSFVSLVFYTRTFSNAAESSLFASLILLVISSMPGRNIVHSRKDRRRYFLLGTLVMLGIWIRPTFLAFACVPLLWWLMDICIQKLTSEQNFAKLSRHVLAQCSFVVFGGLTSAIILTLFDSMYFGYLQRGELVFTPFNFILYNLDTSALREHGLHPRIMHFAVNLPLMFGPMALCLFAVMAHVIINRKYIEYPRALVSGRKPNKNQETDHDYQANFIWSMLFCSIVVSVALLSFIPHQEPRFISPVLSPLVILFACCLDGSSFKSIAVLSWVIWNILGCAVFGMMHQGGIYPCVAYLQQYLYQARSLQTSATQFHVTFYHTYMPPQHLLAWPLPHEKHINMPHSLAVHDLKGSSNDMLMKHVEKLSKEFEAHNKKYEVRY